MSHSSSILDRRFYTPRHERGSTTLMENEMRNSILVALICFAASVAFATAGQFQSLNVKPGLWHMTETIKWTELPPQLAAMMKAAPQTRTYNSCVTTKDLKTNPWTNGSEDHCTWTVLNSTSTDMEVQATGCDFGESFGMTAEVHGKIHILDSENGSGSMTVTMSGSGQTLHGLASYTGKWVTASCAAQ
jgi:hypothetical protein